MPYAAQGSVAGCGLAPGPALTLANWTSWLTFFLETIIFKLIKLPHNQGELAQHDDQYGSWKHLGWKGYYALFQAMVFYAAVVYGLYDLALGYEIGITGPGAILSHVMFLRQYRRTVGAGASLLRSVLLYLPIVFLFGAWVAAYVVLARGAGIIVDETKLSGCLAAAQEFLDVQDLGLKRSLPAVMFVCNIALFASDFAWRRGRLDDDIFFMWGGYIVFGIITLVLHVIDAFVGVGGEFECGGCSVHSGLGYYNYHVNWYKQQDGTVRQGAGKWYRIQNAFQS